MLIDDQYKINLKKIGPHNRYTCIFIYENTFYIAKNNDINIKVNGSLDFAFSILTLTLSLRKRMSAFSSNDLYFNTAHIVIYPISYHRGCVSLATSLIDINTYFQWRSAVA